MILKCERCQYEGNVQLIESGPHLKATCTNCKRYIKFVSKKERSDDVSFNTPLDLVEGRDYESTSGGPELRQDEGEDLPW
ncbi:hypothetical protein LCGC14_0429930 [marine sediment metagenome]|uniref:Uncharacterized protein n=1 Tax=marine sediment metagenome TaxID=412755 RepID=A0A0F9T6L1_9ZZZZ